MIRLISIGYGIIMNRERFPRACVLCKHMIPFGSRSLLLRNVMNRLSGIYYIENKLNGKKYIGQSADLDRRERDHFTILNNGNHWNPHLQRAYSKYSKDMFEFKVILYAEPDELTRYEQELVDKYKPEELYNICLECVDSLLGVKRSEETRKNMSIARSGKNNPNYGKPAWNRGKHHSEEARRNIRIASKKHFASPRGEETRRKISIAQIGENNHFYGKHLSEEHKSKISVANSGKNNPNYGKHRSEETKRKISVANSGENHPLYGKHPSEETRRKMSVANTNPSEETRKKMSVAHIGKHHSEESKRKIGIALTGRPVSKETRRKLSIAHTGKHPSEEARRKMSIARTGKPAWNRGKSSSEETRRKLSVAQSNRSEETKRNMSIAAKKSWAKRKKIRDGYFDIAVKRVQREQQQMKLF